MLFLKFFCNSQIVQRKFLVRSKPRQILHIIGAYTMSCKQGSKRGAYIEPRENHYCALGYARANAQPKARQPTRPKGHFIDTFSFFSSFSLTKKHEPQGSCFFVVWGGDWKVRCIGKWRAIRRDFMRCAQPAVRMGQDPSLHYYPEKGFFDKLRDAYMRPLQPAGSKCFTDYRLLSGNL